MSSYLYLNSECGFSSDGVRRSALISLSNLSDDRMRDCKSNQWWLTAPTLAYANNSVAYTEKPDIGTFMREWLSLYNSKSGERGIFNRDGVQKAFKKTGLREWDHEFGLNPCGEIILRSRQYCNLSSVVIRPDDTYESLSRKIRLATILGTFQSDLTNFRFLSKEWKKNCEEERLIGVSLNGIMDHYFLSNRVTDFEGFDKPLKETLQDLKQITINVNREYAEYLGINPSVSTTTIKPEGCVTPDTLLKTNQIYPVSMEEIFKKAGFKINDETKKLKTFWIDIKPEFCLPFILDENNQLKEIKKLFINGIAEVFEVEFEDGNKYKFTSNHKLKSMNGWKEIHQLSEKDEIISFDSIFNLKIVKITKLEPELTLDIEVDGHTYQLSNGCVSHNTSSQLVDCSSGIHTRYSQYYVRSVRSDVNDPLARMMKDMEIPWEPDAMKPHDTVVFYFPLKAPEHSTFRDELTAIDQLELYRIYKENYTTHNVSQTIYIKESEWLEVGTWVYRHFDIITGLSFLPYSDHTYKQAPYDPITKDKYEELINKFPKNIDWSHLSEYENDDETTGSKEFACVAGMCEI